MDKQTKEVTIKKAEVMKDLERVEPAVTDAQNGMKSIKKQLLGKVRSMASLPPCLKMAVERAGILRGEISPIDWKGVRDITMMENVLPRIIDFNINGITDNIKKIVARDYLSNPEYTYDRIYQANVACGRTVKQELRALEEAAVIKKKEASRMHKHISNPEASINRYKGEEKAKRLQKMKAEKRSSWKSLQTGDVYRETAGKSPLSGDVQLEVAGKTKAWKTWEQGPTSHPDHC